MREEEQLTQYVQVPPDSSFPHPPFGHLLPEGEGQKKKHCRQNQCRPWVGTTGRALRGTFSRGEKDKKERRPLGAVLEYCILRNVDACETTLNPGAQVGTLENHRASRCKADLHTRYRRAPVVVIKGQGECLRALSRTAEDAWPV